MKSPGNMTEIHFKGHFSLSKTAQGFHGRFFCVKDDWSRCDTRVTVMLAKSQISDDTKIIAYIPRNHFSISNNWRSYKYESLLLRWRNRDTRVTP